MSTKLVVHLRARAYYLIFLLVMTLVALSSALAQPQVFAQEPSGETPVYPVMVIGRLLHSDGSPAAGVPVRLVYCTSFYYLCTQSQSTSSNAEGVYEFRATQVEGTPSFLGFGDDTTYHKSYWHQQGLSSIYWVRELDIDYDNLPLDLGDETVYKITGATKGTIHGVVSAGNTPKAGIEVHLYAWTQVGYQTWDWAHILGPVLTGADGSFSADVPEGQYQIRAKDPSGELAVHLGGYYAGVYVFPGHSFDGNASLVPASKITGVVRNAQGQPLAGITVQASCGEYCMELMRETTTAADGTYTIMGLHEAKWTIATLVTDVYAPGVHGTDGNATPILVGKSATVPNINVTVQKAAAIEGRVLGDSGNTIAGIEVCIASEYGSCDGDAVLTNAEGEFEIRGLHPRSVVLRFEDPAGIYISRFYHNEENFQEATLIALQEAKTTALQDQVLIRGATISGRVIDEAGNPIAAQVSAYLCIDDTCEWVPNTSGSTEANGTYRIGFLSAGQYKVRVSSSGAVAYVQQWYDDATDEASADSITLEVGKAVGSINFILVREDGTTPEAGGHPLTPTDPLSFDVPFGGGRLLEVSAPAGAVNEQVRLWASAANSSDLFKPTEFKFGNVAFTVFATQDKELVSPMTFEKPVRFTITYLDVDVEGTDEEDFKVFHFDEASRSWKSDGITVVERLPAQNKIVVEVTHLTTFGLFAGEGEVESGFNVWLPKINGPQKP